MTINCVITTFNRLDLLKENLNALNKQTFHINKIFIIDNCSTDGTQDFLRTLSNERPDFYIVIRTSSNIGGAGGFSLGIKEAVKNGCDYVWVMDDDTIPNADSLQLLAETVENNSNIGYVCSRVNWSNGDWHAMNIPMVDDKQAIYDEKQACLPVTFCTFVSVLINSEAIYKLGLPIKEFFIWSDDVEYTWRISRAGYKCLINKESVVVHKTKTNHTPHLKNAPSEMAWRFYYQARNSCYVKRVRSNWFIFVLSVINKYRLYMRHLNERQDKSCNEQFKKVIKKGCWDGITFNPPIEYINRD